MPKRNSLNLLAKSSPSNKSIGVAPSRVASCFAAGVKEPVVTNNPLSALPTRAPLKSLIAAGPTESLYLLH